MTPIFTLGLTLLALVIPTFAIERNVVCYYGSWATYRNGEGRFAVEHIDPFLCTHLIYSFVGIHSNGTVSILDPWLDLEDNWGLGTMRKFNDLKAMNPKLKTLIAVGGWNEGSQKFSNVAQSATLRLRFAKDAADFCEQLGFDGLDVDWEYPGQRDGDPSVDRENFIDLLSDLKQEFSSRGLLLTAAVAATENSATISYNISEISKHLDFINLMTYDLHGPWDSVTGHNAPLYAGSNDNTGAQRQLNVQASVSYWLQQGAPAQKLNLGVAFYGRSFTLRNAGENGIGAQTSGPGHAGPYTYESGFLGYNEICELQFEKWYHCWDSEQQVPYAYSGNQWVGYDNPESITLKANLIKRYGLAGGMVWSIETDDFLGKCGEKFALLSTLYRGLEQDGVTTTTTTTPTNEPTTTSTSTYPTESTGATDDDNSTWTSTSTTTEKPSPVECVESGYFRDPDDCSKFYYCQGFTLHSFQCPAGLYFDLLILSCNYPERVDC